MTKKTLTVTGLMLATIAFAATGVLADDLQFVGPGDDWADANNWSPSSLAPPTDFDPAQIGWNRDDPARIYAGTAAECAGLELASWGPSGGNGTLTIDANASLDVYDSWVRVGYSGGFMGNVATLTVDGTLTHDGGNFNVGGGAIADVTLNAGGTITTGSWVTLGKYYSGTDGYDTTITQTGGLFETTFDSGTAVEMFEVSGKQMHYKMSGGTISVPNGAWWTNGGTFEVAGDVYANIPLNMTFNPAAVGTATLKFSGTDPLYDSNDAVYFRQESTYVNVDDLTLTTSNDWVTVMEARGIWRPFNAVLDPATDTNVWDMRIVNINGATYDDRDPNDTAYFRFLQVKYTGGCEVLGDLTGDQYVDDKDLSLILANWHATGTPYDIAGGDDYIDDKDLSIILANWHASCPAPAGAAVPEPMTLAILGVGTLGLIRRRRR